MKKIGLLLLLSASVLLGMNTVLASTQENVTAGFTKAQQADITPQGALDLLKEGNERFVNNQNSTYDFPAIRKSTALGQYPFAVVLSCLDSRSSPEIIFQQGPGNIFVARVAGNVVDTNILGSMEYATKYVGSKLIVVMGHTDCGAVKGACGRAGEGNLKILLKEIRPAVYSMSLKEKKDCHKSEFINDIAKQNVINQVNAIYDDSDTIKQLVDEHKVLLVGAMQNLVTGKVDFFYTFEPVKK